MRNGAANSNGITDIFFGQIPNLKWNLNSLKLNRNFLADSKDALRLIITYGCFTVNLLNYLAVY